MSEEETKSVNISNGVDMSSISTGKSVQFADDNVADDDVDNFDTSKLNDDILPTTSQITYTDITVYMF